MRIKDLNSSTAVHLNLLNPYFKLPTCSGSSKKQGNSRKTSTSASPTTLKPLCRSQQTVENSSTDGNNRPPDLSREDLLEKEMATHSSILAWKIPWTEAPGGLQSTGLQRLRHDWATSLSFFLSFTWHVSWETCMQVKKQQLEPDVEQQTGLLGKEYVKAVNRHPAYLTYIQSTSYKILGWMNLRMESRLQGEISITSDMQMTPPLW